MFDRVRKSLARWISPKPVPRTSARTYAMARPARMSEGWGLSSSSENSELSSSLALSRSRARQLIRDAAYAKRAKVIIQNNVVGSGIGMQAKVVTTRGDLNDTINNQIEEAWEDWTCGEYCHTGGEMHFSDLERAAMGQVFDAGEVIIRTYPQRFGNSTIPLALELIEAERIADDIVPNATNPANTVRLGIESDVFHRPVAYWIRSVHPGELRFPVEKTSKIERVSAEHIIHLRLIDRWPQARAIPWMHAAARKLNDMDGLTDAEITAARGAACFMGIIETPAGETSFGEEQADGSHIAQIDPGTVEKLDPGEKYVSVTPTRPNTGLDPFMRMMLREVAAGCGVSYESLSKDYSQSNYSSSRLALLDDRDLWRFYQSWFIRSFRMRLHRLWLQQAIYAGAIPGIRIGAYAVNPKWFEKVQFKPRGWSWIDPTKEVAAAKDAIRSGFTTVTAVIAQTGNGVDFEDVLKERQQELKMMEGAGLSFETDPVAFPDKAPAKPEPATGDPGEADTVGADPTVNQAEKMLRNVRGAHA